MPDCPEGRRKTCRAPCPNTSGCPGMMRTRSKKNSAPRSASTRSTMSYLPAETPPESSSMSKRKPVLDQFASGVVHVARNGQDVGTASGALHLHGQRLHVRIADLVIERRFTRSRRSRRPWPEIATCGRAKHRNSVDVPPWPAARCRRSPGGVRLRAGLRPARACDACGLTFSPGRDACAAPSRDRPPRVQCSTITTESAPRGKGAPVMISTASPGLNFAREGFARPNFADHEQVPRQIRGPHGKSIAHRARDRRIIAIGAHRLGEHSARRFRKD